MSTKHEETSKSDPQDHGVEINPGVLTFDTEKGTPPLQPGTPIDEQLEDTLLVSPIFFSSNTANPIQVTWDSPSDPNNPINWPRPQKWAISIFVSLGGFVTLMSGSMIAPAL